MLDNIPRNTFEFERLKNVPKESVSSRTLLTIKIGSLTSWVRDVFAIVLMWKIISILPKVASVLQQISVQS